MRIENVIPFKAKIEKTIILDRINMINMIDICFKALTWFLAYMIVHMGKFRGP